MHSCIQLEDVSAGSQEGMKGKWATVNKCDRREDDNTVDVIMNRKCKTYEESDVVL